MSQATTSRPGLTDFVRIGVINRFTASMIVIISVSNTPSQIELDELRKVVTVIHPG
jgi:hypothetical protein